MMRVPATEEDDNRLNDTIVLTIPTDPPFRGVASLVLGAWARASTFRSSAWTTSSSPC